MITHWWAIILALISAVFCGLGPIYLKRGADKFRLHPKHVIKNKPLIKGIGLYLLATVFFIPALTGGEMSVIYPVAATAYIWVCIFSMLMLKEKMNIIKWTGISTILLGIVFIAAGI
jgi:uncharacterized membrane protein